MQLGTHEDFSRKMSDKGPSDRSFGLVFAGFFTVLSLWPLLRARPLRLWALAPAAVFLLIAATAPGLLHPLNRLWMRIGVLIGKVTNPIVTGVMFYLVFTPASYFLQLLGKDLLRLRPDPEAASYWIRREPPGPSPESVRHQF